MSLSRRNFFKLAGASAASVTMLSPLEAFYARVARGQVARNTGFGPLEPKLALNASELTDTIYGNLSKEPLLALPPGFNYRAISITGQLMDDGYTVASDHDGMAAFPGPNNTTILVRNHEVRGTFGKNSHPVQGDLRYSAGLLGAAGGTSTVVVGPNGKVIKHFNSLAGTSTNCAGGPTPWGTWITCEETFSTTTSIGTTEPVKHGYNFEVVADADSGLVTPVPLKAMGRFVHEAVAVDPNTHYIYETEDKIDSCFYRFVPNAPRPLKPGALTQGGTLYALKIKGNFPANTTNNLNFGGVANGIPVGVPMHVEWVTIDTPDPGEDKVRYEAQKDGAAIFLRGEGAWYGNGLIYFIATQGGPPAFNATNGRGNGQVWAYNPAQETLTLLIEASPSGELLDEPDNITVSPFGDLFLCEDGGGEQYVVGVNNKGELYQFAKNIIFANNFSVPNRDDLVNNEFAGACFSPDGRTMFVNIMDPGITFAITGPWNRKRA